METRGDANAFVSNSLPKTVSRTQMGYSRLEYGELGSLERRVAQDGVADTDVKGSRQVKI